MTNFSWFLFHLIFEIFSALTTAYYFLPDSTCFSLYFHMLCYYFSGFFFHPFTAGLKLSFLPLAKHSFFLPNLWEPTFYLFHDALIPLHVFHRTLPEIPVRSEIKSELKISTKIKHVILSFDYLKSWMTGHIIENTFVCVNFCCIKNPDTKDRLIYMTFQNKQIFSVTIVTKNTLTGVSSWGVERSGYERTLGGL